jgi:hypothetical protein
MPGNFSTQGVVTDAILQLLANQNLTYAAPFAQNPTPVPIFDGPPGGAGVPPVFIAIGGQDPELTIGTEDWSWLGTASRYENYNLIGHTYAYVGGDDNLGQFQSNDAQKTARDQAITLVQAVEAALCGDPTLHTVNTTTVNYPLVTWAYVVKVNLVQPTADDPNLASGRWAGCDFTINVKNTLTGPSVVWS